MIQSKAMGELSEVVTSNPPEMQYGDVVEVLSRLKETGFLDFMKNQVKGGDFFKKTVRGLGDTSEAGVIFDLFEEQLEKGKVLPYPLYFRLDSKFQKAAADVLRPKTELRKVLFAYYGIDDRTPWYRAKEIIGGRVGFIEVSFPTADVVNDVLEKLNGVDTQTPQTMYEVTDDLIPQH